MDRQITRNNFVFRLVFILLCLWSGFATELFAETYTSHKIKPRWISEVPSGNLPYTFEVTFVDMASTLDGARQASKKELYNMIAKRENISVQEVYDYKSQQQGSGLNITEKSDEVYTMKIQSQGETVNLTYKKIDEYWIEEQHGSVKSFKLYTLYAVARPGMFPTYNDVEITEKYGFGPVAMSLLPGAGQMYKGSYLKGGLILGSEVVLISSVILCENQRIDYHNKVKEQPQFAKEYNTKSNNWATGRNLMIGLAGAMYVYNLIDAAVSNGARRVRLNPTKNFDMSWNPCIMLDQQNQPGVGVQFSLKF